MWLLSVCHVNKKTASTYLLTYSLPHLLTYLLTCTLQRALTMKRDEISERFNEAFDIKSDLDERFHRLEDYLRDVLNASEMDLYVQSTRLLVQTRLDEQWIEDRIEVGKRQLAIFDAVDRDKLVDGVGASIEHATSLLVRDKSENS